MLIYGGNVRPSSVLLTSIVVCISVLVAPSGYADEVADDYVTLPIGDYSDMLVDKSHDQVFVGGNDGLVVIPTGGGAAVTLPDVVGVQRLSIDEDASTVYAAVVHAIVAVDTASLDVRRYEVGEEACPRQVAARGGYVWFFDAAGSCGGQGWQSLMRLDPESGTVVAADIFSGHPDYLSSPVLREIPGTSRMLVVETNSSSAEMAVVDTAGGASTLVSTVEPGSSPSYTGVEVAPDGSSAVLVAHAHNSIQRWALPDLSQVGDPLTVEWPDPFAPSFATSGPRLALVDGPRAAVLSADTGSEQAAVDFGPGAVVTRGVDVDGDALYAVTSAEAGVADYRLYAVTMPPTPGVDLSMHPPVNPRVGVPTTLSGTLTEADGDPLVDSVVVVRETDRAEELGRATTDATGAWSLQHTWNGQQEVTLKVEYAGDVTRRAARLTRSMWVSKRPSTVTLSGPSNVSPTQTVELTGSLTEELGPVAGASVEVDGYCWPNHWRPVVSDTTTGADGTFTVTHDPPDDCDRIEYTATYRGNVQLDGSTVDADLVVIDWNRPWLWITSAGFHVGDTGRVDVQFNDGEGGVLVGEPVTIRVTSPSGATSDLGTHETDSLGRASVQHAWPEPGTYCHIATWPGDADSRPARRELCQTVTTVETSFDLDFPSSGKLDESAIFTGRLVTSVDEEVGALPLQVSRYNESTGETADLGTVTTAADGSFKFTDTPEIAGRARYIVRFAGTERYRASAAAQETWVEYPPSVLTLRTDRSAYQAGQTALLDIGLTTKGTRKIEIETFEGSSTVPRSSTSYAVPVGGLLLRISMKHNTTFKVTSLADDRSAGDFAQLTRTVSLRLGTVARGHYGVSGRSHLYRRWADPRFVTSVSPHRSTTCLRHQVQTYSLGTWRSVLLSGCARADSLGEVRWTLTGRQKTGPAYRVRPRFAGDSWNRATDGTWTYFRFR